MGCQCVRVFLRLYVVNDRVMPVAETVLLCQELSALEDLVAAHGQPRYRGKQLRDALMHGAQTLDDITLVLPPLLVASPFMVWQRGMRNQEVSPDSSCLTNWSMCQYAPISHVLVPPHP